MWEAVDHAGVEEVDKVAISCGEKKTVRYLRKVSSYIYECGLPSCIAVSLSSKGMRMGGKMPEGDECPSCGSNLDKANSLKMEVEHKINERRILATCRGCDMKFRCGDLPSIQIKDSNKTSTSVPSKTPVVQRRDISKKPVNSQSQQRTPKTGNKRRGSALQRLLHEEESESDRSLSGFLNQFGMQ